ncbi:uncharacterized protein UV8b_07084 [Ustilaginoidea virens]|uniref:Uncharacterized protein n=1 Tax=Ustilaginoidea virens TaxID=1159556 RepID=A0A063CBH8_USTVR|nr:uncharacterized protein UV8b_07084 [Ustilaginoidea virens]QUC22843.1 hypothetical protein UV8b_07084 [Ustilaginoidea virens]GAO15354.1 hypothetical protein UVI_02010190 [Ustilaginoidea virens]
MATHEEKSGGHSLTESNLAVPDAAAKVSSIRVFSLERTASGTTARSDNSNPFETDVEAMATNNSIDKPRASVVLTRKKDCQVWPNKSDWKQRAKAGKKNRSCAFMQRFSRRTRITMKILMVVLVVSIAIAVGFGVSRPLGAPIWGEKSKSS